MKLYNRMIIIGTLLVGLLGCDKSLDREEHRFETGDLLVNRPYLTWNFGDGNVRIERYFFLPMGTQALERMDQSWGGSGPLSSFSDIRIVKENDRIAIILGGYVYRRAIRKGGHFWHRWSFYDRHGIPAYFDALKKFNLINARADMMQDLVLSELDTHYVVKQVDLANNTILLSRKSYNESLPTELVFSQHMWDSPFSFDLLKTLKRNPQICVPGFQDDVVVSVRSVIVDMPSSRIQKNWNRMSFDEVMTLPGAEVVLRRSTPVSVEKESIVNYSSEPISPSGHQPSLSIRGLWDHSVSGHIVVLMHNNPQIVRADPWIVKLGKDYNYLRRFAGTSEQTLYVILRFDVLSKKQYNH